MTTWGEYVAEAEQYRLYKQRCEELEAALQELVASVDDIDPRLSYVYLQPDRAAYENAVALASGGDQQ